MDTPSQAGPRASAPDGATADQSQRQQTARIPVNLITGFLGVGKTSAIRQLLSDVSDERIRWGVLINEFGAVGIDAALLGETGVVVREVPGGCLCCVASAAFTTGLNRLIREQRPQRILIEPSGLAHPAKVLELLSGPTYRQILELRATLCLVDARQLDSARHRTHPLFDAQVDAADILVANKCDLYGPAQLDTLQAFVDGLRPAKALFGRVQGGRLLRDWLDYPAAARPCNAAHSPHSHHSAAAQPALIKPAPDWSILEGWTDGYHSVGWLIHQSRPVPFELLRPLLTGIPGERKKGIFLTSLGWFSFNQTDWRSIAAPADRRTRLEIIDAATIDVQSIDLALRGICQDPV